MDEINYQNDSVYNRSLKVSEKTIELLHLHRRRTGASLGFTMEKAVEYYTEAIRRAIYVDPVMVAVIEGDGPD